ncbi:P-loop containing nucleoside triphosphate hydrolase protein [Nemania abortiva]|nr:P-loop containing nucleoside triphosphate hydrolase protein [Nemania abortiva]
MAEPPDRRAAAAKCSASWSRKVDTELFEYTNRGRARFAYHQLKSKEKEHFKWDPYERFTRKEDLTKFYSGHDYRCHSLRDRECYAKFAIEQILKGHPNDSFEATGEIMKHESVADQSDEPEAIDNIVRAIRADGQQDVDAEIPQDTVPRASKADDDESTQKIGSAAQSLIAASPNSLGPPIEPCAAYLNMTRCGHYGRSNSSVWKSPLFPKLDGQDGRRGLLDHQVTAIVWLLSRMFGDLPTLKVENPITGGYRSNITTSSDKENRARLKGPKYFGGILADSMGLGKTLIIITLMDLLMSQRLNVMRGEDGTSKHCPILLLTPNATVANQWVQELSQVIDKSMLRHIVVSGNGLEAKTDTTRIIHLGSESFKHWPADISYMWDKNNPQASRSVLIMTMESWARRTFVVDEAYKVKNPSTKNWRSVYLLERQFTLLITATPCMNTLTDLFGLARLLWTAPERYLRQNVEKWEEIEQNFQALEHLDLLDGYSPSHDFQLVAGRPALLAQLLCKHRNSRTHDINLTCKYLRHFETLAMLKRAPSSYLYADWEKTNPISLEGLFPKVENYTVDISLDEAYDKEYQAVHIDLLIKYLEGLKDWGCYISERNKKCKKEEENTKEPIMDSIRLLQMASSSLDVYDLDAIITANGHSTRAEKIAEMREKEVNLLRLAQFLVSPNETTPETHLGWMELVTRNSPILRYILYYINENILTRRGNGPIKKLLIVEHSLMLAFYYELVLQFLGFECRCMHAQLSFEERQKLVDSFNSSDNKSCQIMIQLYTVGFAGTNLHKSCSRVLVASQSHSLQVQWQAIHRVIRVGQDSDVTVHRVKLKNSYHSFRESRQIEKILPELGARAQGNTKKLLVRLLNLFQYEVEEAWNSAEGVKLREEKNLLEDDDVDEPVAPAVKKAKPNNCLKFKINTKDKIKLENKIKVENKTEVKDRKIKSEDDQDNGKICNLFVSNAAGAGTTSSSTTSIKRKQSTIVPKTGDGDGGWYNHGGLTDHDAFLELRTRDDYYQEFIDLPRDAKSRFSHLKNSLRRLLSYGNDNGALSKLPWKETDLENPAVLERALELMLRVRLGAPNIAMLPFPMIDLSKAPAAHRTQLQLLLAYARHTDQDLEKAGGSGSGGNAAKDLRETLRGADIKKPLAQIDRDLETQARFGDGDTASSAASEAKKKAPARAKVKVKVKVEAEEEAPGQVIDLTDDAEGDIRRKSEKAKGKEIIVIDEDDDGDNEVVVVDANDGKDSTIEGKKIKKEEQ